MRHRIHEIEAIEAVAHRQRHAARRAQRHRAGLGGQLPYRVVAGMRIEAMQRLGGNIDPIEQVVMLVPRRRFADAGMGIDDTANLVAHREAPASSGGRGNSLPAGTPTRPALSSSATFIYSPISEIRSTSCSSPRRARARSNTASATSWRRISAM